MSNGRIKLSNVEFYNWRIIPGNREYLRQVIRKHAQDDGQEVRDIAALVADHLKRWCHVIPLGGPQYGQLFSIIKDVLNEDPNEGFDMDC